VFGVLAIVGVVVYCICKKASKKRKDKIKWMVSADESEAVTPSSRALQKKKDQRNLSLNVRRASLS